MPASTFGLLYITGGLNGKDRPSAVNRTPRLFVAHQHYAMLYRLATPPGAGQDARRVGDP